MKHSNFSRVLSVMLVLVMVLSMVPAAVFAADSAVYSQITSADELTTGKYVMVVSTGYAPTVLDGTWVQTEAVTAENGKITVSNQITKSEIKGMTNISIKLRATVVQSGGFENPTAAWNSIAAKER